MFKSKHSGWTWELKRTPFGGGGGSFNPIAWTEPITNDISSVVGTDGSGGGIIGNTQNIINSASSGNPLDVTSAILGTDGSGLGALGALAQVDNSVHTLIPGGWATVAAIAATIASAGAASETLAATTGGEAAAGTTAAAAGGGAAAGSDAAFMAYDASNLAAQGLSQEAIAQNLATSYGISAADAQSLAAASADAYATSGAAPAGFESAPPPTSTPGADQVLAQPDVNVNLGATNGGTVNSLNPALPAAGAPSGTSVGMSGQLAPGTVLGNGLQGGGAIGSSYAAGANGMPATDFFGNYVPASSINTGGVPNTIAGTTGTTTNTDLLKLLKQGAGSGLSSSLGKLAAGQNASASALPNLVRGNQSPFAYTAQQPIRDAQPMDLNSLANLLKQG